jgi:hypothetical protein
MNTDSLLVRPRGSERLDQMPPQAVRAGVTEPPLTTGRSSAPTPIKRTAIRRRRALPPPEARDWLTPNDVALALGCSVATVHRLRRGLLPGIEPLPYSQYGRKVIFRKVSLASWQERTEKTGLAA